MRSMITAMQHEGRTLARAHVWTDKGYSSKTFSTHQEAAAWIDAKRST